MKKNQKIIIALSMLMCIILCCACVTKATEKDYEYDDSGRVTKVVYEDGSYETYEYDDNGNITQINYVNPNVDSSEEDKTTEGSDTSTEDSRITTENPTEEAITSIPTEEEVNTSTITEEGKATSSSTEDETSITGDETPVGILISVMITMIIGIGLIIRKTTKEKR